MCSSSTTHFDYYADADADVGLHHTGRRDHCPCAWKSLRFYDHIELRNPLLLTLVSQRFGFAPDP